LSTSLFEAAPLLRTDEERAKFNEQTGASG
jgi:hypothetical protein